MSRRKGSALTSRETFHVLTSEGAELAVKGAAPHALLVAQRAAEQSKEEAVLTVERHSLFGPSTPIYRVTRAADGAVYTNSSQED